MNFLVLFAAVLLFSAAASLKHQEDIEDMTTPLKQIVQCKCGKTKLAIDSPSALRIVCYSKDYRGYYNTLNEQAKAKGNSPSAKLDPWGGVDLTQIYVSF